MARSFNTERMVLGLTIAWVGLVATLGNIGWIDTLYVLHRWWPWTLVAWGALDLVRVQRLRREKAERSEVSA